jgi:hypothetical protein
MSNSGRLIAGVFGVAAFALLTPFQVAQAAPAVAIDLAAASSNGHVIKVHDRWRDDDDDDDDDREYRRHRHSRHYYRDHDDDDDVVEAPFTRVEHGRRVVVDAPFSHVYVGRRGRHIVAPFVNIWIPR